MIKDLWYKNAIIYCLDVATYMDANGDGIGDFTGLISKLDYLEELGVTAIWLLPFYPSPLKDEINCRTDILHSQISRDDRRIAGRWLIHFRRTR